MLRPKVIVDSNMYAQGIPQQQRQDAYVDESAFYQAQDDGTQLAMQPQDGALQATGGASPGRVFKPSGRVGSEQFRLFAVVSENQSLA